MATKDGLPDLAAWRTMQSSEILAYVELNLSYAETIQILAPASPFNEWNCSNQHWQASYLKYYLKVISKSDKSTGRMSIRS